MIKIFSCARGIQNRLAIFAIATFAMWLQPALVKAATITFVQGNYAVPQSSKASVSVTFTAAQTAGDLNVVVVGWNDSTATVNTVTDKSGNVYTRAVGPTVQTGLASQSIYYAKNIAAAAAGANIVTVTFSSTAAFPDIRIVEYKGADTNNPVDVTAASSGNSATSSSGAATTTNATDLLFGANLVQTSTTGPGTGFNKVMLTSPDGDIVEQEMVTATGSYSATAPLHSGQWIMQMVAFRTPSGGANTPTVTSVSPNTGTTAGGTPVTITGTNFAAGATVTFGAAAATNVVVVSSTSITATTPAGSAGPVTVTVTVSGQSGSLSNGFTYVATPTVTSVSPNTGTTAGGTSVTITGTNFVAGASVTFGTAAATNVVLVSSTSITATTPAGSAGSVTVTVAVSGLSGSLTNGFTYAVIPSVTSVSPNTGTTAGGTSVTITGTNFASGATVTLGGTAATNVVVVNSTSITATTPAGSAGVVTVTVTVGGQSGSLSNGFTYVAPPTVTSVSPSTGTTAGGTAVTITGTNFASGATVRFGATAAANVVVVNSTTITATTPAGSAGSVTVTVTVSGLSGSLSNGFNYAVIPSVTSLSPNTGTTAGGTPVTITGTNFAAGATVTFAGTAAINVIVVSSTSITATTPAGSAGTVTVTVTVGGQSGSLSNGFTYVAPPTLTIMSPNTGTTAGGTSVTITGTNFAAGATVTFGVTAATNVVVVNSTTITATTPAGSAGAVTVTVTVNGLSASLTNGFSYVVPTSITYVQGNYADPQSSPTTVSVTYTAAQVAGDLNVVVVGWNNSTATVTGVTDKSGNQYVLAVGPTVQAPVASQSIYYAKNILGAAAGANSITVTFSAAAAFPDIRILEYSGADPNNPVDVTAASSGSSGISSSGSVTTTNATDLLFGANLVQTLTSGAGTGFTKRLLTSPDGDIAEDEMVSATGSYSATAPLSPGQWIMQMVAFRTPSGGAPVLQSITVTPANPAIVVSGQQQFTATGNYSNGTQQNLSGSATWTSTNTPVATISTAGLATGVTTGTTTIQAAVGSVNGSTTLTVNPQSSFTIAASPNAVSVPAGSQGTSTIATTISGSFNSAISLSAAGAPTGTTVSFNPGTIPAPGSGTSSMTITVGSSTTVGIYPITVTGSGGGIQQTATVTLTVTAPQPCSNTNLGNGITCVAVVSASNATGTNVSSLSTTSSLNVLPGDSLVAEVRYESGAITNGGVTVETSAGDTLLYANGTSGSGGAFAAQIYYVCGAIANAASTPTVYFGASQAYASIIVHQYRGLVTHPASNSCLDVTATGTANGTSVTSATFTTTQPNEVAFAVSAVNNNGVSFAPGAGYTEVATDPGGQSATEQAAFASIQTGAAASMSFPSNPGAIVVATFIAGTTNVGAGIPVGHGVVVWAAVNDTSTNCSGTCVLKVTDSKGNSYTTLQTNNQTSANVTNFLAFGNITTALAGDGSDWVKCSFYQHNGVTPVNSLDFTYCRVVDMSQVASSGYLDSSNQHTDSNAITDSGALTVTSGNTDLIFAIWDIASTTVTATPGTGFNGIQFGLDGGGGEQYGEYTESTAGLTPGVTLSSGVSTYGAGVAIKESSPGGTVTSVNGEVGVHVNSSSLTIQIPQWYGNGGDTQAPTAPGNLVASAVSTSQINLTWTASTDNVGVSNYLVERCQGAGCANFQQIATPTTLTFSDTSLAINTSYSYRVRAIDAAGNLSQYSNVATASTLSGNVPTAPTNVSGAFGGPVPTVVTVQSYDNSTFLTSHTTAAFNSTGGDLIVIAASSHSGVTLTPGDSLGNVWIPIAGPTNTSAGAFDLRTQLWYAHNPIVGPGHTVTITLSAAQPLVISVIVAQGSNLSSPIDAVSLIGNDNGTHTTNVISPGITTTSANDLLMGFAKVSAGAAFQSGTGFTLQASSSFLAAETGSSAAPGAYNATFTLSSQQSWESVVVAAASNPDQGTLSWTASTETGGTISQYLVERCQGAACASFAQIGTTTTTSYRDPGLSAATSYSYRIRAQDTGNNVGPYSSIVTILTPAVTPSTPSAPENLTASGPTVIAGQSYVGASASTSHTTASFNSTGGDLLVMSATSFAGVTFTPTDSFGNKWVSIAGPTSTMAGSDLRMQVWYVMNPIVGPGHTVTMGLSTAQPLTMSVNVVKGSNVSSPIDAVSLISSDNGTQTTNVASPSITTTSMNDLLIGFAQVSGGAGFLASSGSTVIGASSSNYLVADANPAAMPGSYSAGFIINVAQTWLSAVVAAANSPNQVTLSWTPAPETGGNVIGGTISNYLVERCQDAGCTSFAQIGTTTGTTFNETGLSAVTSYSYRVRAQDTAGILSPYSAVVTVVPSGLLPSAPGNLVAAANRQGPIALTWTASTGTLGIANYAIQRCQNSGCSNFAQVGTATGTTYTDSTVLSATTYSYRVQAIDTAGNLSPFSNTATITSVGSQPPTAPSNLTATAASTSQINLSWTASTSTIGLANYVVQRCQGAGCTNFAQVATPVGTTYNDTGLSANTSYSYQVEALDIEGNISPFSNVASATTTSSTSTTITYVQGAYATPQSSSTTVTVAYTAAQAAGDLNVVVVGWNNSTATVSAVTDKSGNQYLLAVGPTVQSPVATQSIYYAKNIASAAAGANAVTVTFSTAAAYPDIRILEYNGADPSNPIDVTAANTGTGSPSNSGSASTNNATDLIFGANLVQSMTTGPGAGFTSRLITSPDGDIAEDQMVTLKGSYNATASVNAGQWIMQMVAFRASGSCAGGPPTVPTNLTATPASSSQVNLSWTASITCVGVAHYVVQRCQGASCTNFAQVATPTGTTFNDTGLAANTSYSYQVQAVDNTGNSSSFSSVASATTPAISISPRFTDVTFTQPQQFTSSAGVTWSVDGLVGGSATTGTINSTGLYTPPSSVGTHIVTATTSDQHSASATVYVTNYPGTYTYHNDNLRTGQNLNETTLTLSNVNQNQFGKLLSYPLDGMAYASPLYVASVNIPGQGYHNVVYVATENDSVYAFDADGLTSTPLWHVSFLKSGVTTVPCADTGECGDILTQIGITSTPVIDSTTGTIYVVAATKEGASTWVQRLHALDISTGAEKFGGPVVIQASVPGTGQGASGGSVPFDALRENQRPALLLSNGVIYLGFGSHGDNNPWHGWALGYIAATLQQTMIFNASPNGFGGGIWHSGGGLATDATGSIYFSTSNGPFDVDTGGVDYGDTIVKLATNGSVADYFTPHDQSNLDANNIDLGSAGPVLLVDQPTGAYPHLLISAGKNGTIYVVNRDNMGHYNANNDNQIVQSLPGVLPNGTAESGNFSQPVFFNGYVYFGAVNDTIKAFQLTNGLLSAGPTSQTTALYLVRGASFAISASNNSNGILWALQNNGASADNDVGSPGVLFAYDANNLGTELYDSTQAGSRDTLDNAVKFSIPLIANGKVFIAGQTQLTVFGLLP